MNCRFVQSHLSAYVDAELTGAHQMVVRRHLQDCLDCRSEYEQLRKIKLVLAALSPVVPGSGAQTRCLQRALSSSIAPTAPAIRIVWPETFWGKVAMAAAVAFLVFALAPRESRTMSAGAQPSTGYSGATQVWPNQPSSWGANPMPFSNPHAHDVRYQYQVPIAPTFGF